MQKNEEIESVMVQTRNFPYRLMHLNTWSPAGGIFWEMMKPSMGGAYREELWGSFMSIKAWLPLFLGLCSDMTCDSQRTRTELLLLP